MKSSTKDFFSKYEQIHIFLRIWSHLQNKSLIKNSVFYAVQFFRHSFNIFQFTKKNNTITSVKFLADNVLINSEITQGLLFF